MKASGWTISSMGMEKNLGQMAQFMRESTLLVRNMEEVFTAGMMDPSIMATGKRTKSRDSEPIPG